MSGRTVAIVQARLSSVRLPGKSLAPLGSSTLLGWCVTRAGLSRVDEVVVATSVEPEDEAIAAAAGALGVRAVRGSLDDVLARFATAAQQAGADVIVRLTADCPFVAPEVIDATLDALSSEAADYASTNIDRRIPHGLDTEAMRRSALDAAASEARDPIEREHVTPFVYRHPDRFTCVPVAVPPWADAPELRLTVDEEADLAVARELVARLGDDPAAFPVAEAIALLQRDEVLAQSNAHVQHRDVR